MSNEKLSEVVWARKYHALQHRICAACAAALKNGISEQSVAMALEDRARALRISREVPRGIEHHMGGEK